MTTSTSKRTSSGGVILLGLILIILGLAIYAYPAPAHAANTCQPVHISRGIGSNPVTLNAAAGTATITGTAWDTHPAGAGDRPSQAQNERFTIANWQTPDVPDINDHDEIAFSHTWEHPGGALTVDRTAGSAGLDATICIEPPTTTIGAGYILGRIAR